MTELSAPSSTVWVEVVVALPAHSGLGPCLTYRHDRPLPSGCLVRVPLGSRDTLGMVHAVHDQPPPGLELSQVRPVREAWEALPPLNARWRELLSFAARYYQRGLGEVAMGSLPPALRDLHADGLQRQLSKVQSRQATGRATEPTQTPPPPSPEQAQVLQALQDSNRPVLLFGSTGSGKTEVYLCAAQRLLEEDAQAQVLVMVPEINLTPQLEARFSARFASHGVVALHSGLTPVQRMRHWLSAHLGHARIVLGTRMAIWASMPRLRLIVVDEEHDPSYKSQEGARYSARDLAIYRARLESTSAPCQVLLGSATPSLESWHASEQGRYQRLHMPSRVGGGALPALRLVDMHQQPRQAVIAPALLQAMATRAARGEQSLVLLNRRGYAPVLACHDCGWKSDCPHCSAHAVFHKADRTLRCHHCGHTTRVPRACPACGNLDVSPVGRGTEQMEEQLAGLLSETLRPDGQAVRVARLDADTTRNKGGLAQRLAEMHAGDVDVLVGTQMVAKGHDFRRITLVASLNTDSALFASDYRAPERLFALLMQAAGRAGRDAAFVAAQSASAELWVQTWYPKHPLFAALARHDYPGFAAQQLAERASAHMPPFGHQALVRAEARSQEAAQAWLALAAAAGVGLPGHDHLTLYPAVPMSIQRVARVERAQMLIESVSRPALQAFLGAWHGVLHGLQSPATRGMIRWAIDVDPLTL
jgi:primosomal protein N' (replication factor Y) (superfamily II helicase)